MATKQSMHVPKKATATIILVSFLLSFGESGAERSLLEEDSPRCVDEAGSRASLAPGSRFSKEPTDLFPVSQEDVKLILEYGHVLDEFFWEAYDVGKVLALQKFLASLAPFAATRDEFEKRLLIFKELFYSELAKRGGMREAHLRPLEAVSKAFEAGKDSYVLKLWLSDDGILNVVKVQSSQEDLEGFDTAFLNASEFLNFAFSKSPQIFARMMGYFAKAQRQENPASVMRLIHPEAFLEEVAAAITDAQPALSNVDARLLLIKSAQASVAVHDALCIREFERILYLSGRMADDGIEEDPFFNQDILNRKIGYMRAAISARECAKVVLPSLESEISGLQREVRELNESIPAANRVKNNTFKRHDIKIFEGEILNLWLVTSIRNSIMQTLLEASDGPLPAGGLSVNNFPQLLLKQDGEKLTIKKLEPLVADPDREIVVKPKIVDVGEFVRNLCGPSAHIEVERTGLVLPEDELSRSLKVIDGIFTDPVPDREDTKLDMDLPAGGLSAVDHLTIIERYIKGDDEGLSDFADELAECIGEGRWEDARKMLWVFKEFFWEKAKGANEPLRKAQAFSRPFVGADGKAYKLRMRVLSNRLVEIILFNHEDEVTIHGLKISIKKSRGMDVSTEFLSRLTTFISAESIRKGLIGNPRYAGEALSKLAEGPFVMANLDAMVTSGARGFFEYAFENEPRVFIGTLMAYPFDLEKNFQSTLNGIFKEIKAEGGAPSFYVRCGIILKAELAAMRMLDFRDMMISEQFYLDGKVNPAGTRALQRRLRLMEVLTGKKIPANIKGILSNDWPLLLAEHIAPEKCERGLIKAAHEEGNSESVGFLLKEKDNLVRDFKEERSKVWKHQRAMKRTALAREALIKKHVIERFDVSIRDRLSNTIFRRVLYAALEKTPQGAIEGAALSGFPQMRLHLERGALSIVMGDPYDDENNFISDPNRTHDEPKKHVIVYLSAFLKGERSLNYVALSLGRLMKGASVIFVDDLGIDAGRQKEKDRLFKKLGITVSATSGRGLNSIYQEFISNKGLRVPVIISDAIDKGKLFGPDGQVPDNCLLVVVEHPDGEARTVVANKVFRIVNAILNGSTLPQVKEIILRSDNRQLSWLAGNIDNLSLQAKGIRITPVDTDRLYFDRVKLAASP